MEAWLKIKVVKRKKRSCNNNEDLKKYNEEEENNKRLCSVYLSIVKNFLHLFNFYLLQDHIRSLDCSSAIKILIIYI